MTIQPATEARLRQARRNQDFTNAPMGMGQCALMAPEVAVFPVRYALDESPTKKGDNQGLHPLPKGWSHTPPELQTRSYTLRQLRDGWLYVWNSVDQTFHEYQVQGEQFTRHPWTDSELNKDVRNNPGETQPYLLYPRRSQLRLAYSPVQWTWRLCELMRSTTEQMPWMREVDLPAFCRMGTVDHGGPITELGNSVADILRYGDTAPTFTSTLLPTQAGEGASASFKAAFEEALVRGYVPEQDTALFVALDDPLAMIDDLSMSLNGRRLEQSQFEMTHQHTFQSAVEVQQLCGFDADTFIPDAIDDPIQRQAYIDDLYALLKTHDDIERGKGLVSIAEEGLVELGAASAISGAEARFKSKWSVLPDRTQWYVALEEWNAKRLWREDVRFDEMQTYLSQTTVQVQRLHNHCQRSERDLLTWLNQLGPSAEAVYHDTCHKGQASQLIETTSALYTLLANGEDGQRWLCQQAAQPSRLFGLAQYNFNPHIAALIRQVTQNFSATGMLDDQGREGDGRSPALDLSSVGDVTNVVSRTSEIKSVLDLEAVQNSGLYKALSSATQQAMNTLVHVANNQAKEAWHGLSDMLLPAMRQDAALTLNVPKVLFSHEISSATQLVFNPTFASDYKAWMNELIVLQKKIAGEKSVWLRPGSAHVKRSARLSLQALEVQEKNLFIKRPNQITARASGITRLPIPMLHINGWLNDLGRSEVTEQLKFFGTQEYLKRTKAWIGKNLGSALPALLVGLNVWNTYNIAKQAQNDGRLTADELRNMGSSAAYAANAITALWVAPAWSRAGWMSAKLGPETLKLTNAGYSAWLKESKALTSGTANAAVAGEFAAASKALILRTVTWAAFGAIAAGLEAWQLSNDIKSATSEEEKALLKLKSRIVSGMSLVATGQLIGAGLGYWFGFSWVMSTPVTLLLAGLGIAYLMITMTANRYKREGLRLWLFYCNWGRGPKPEWLGEAGYIRQTQALLETLQRPSVVGRALYTGGGSTPRNWQGFWVQIQVPAVLAGKAVTLQPAIIEKKYWFSDEALQVARSNFYEQFLEGNWIDPKLLGTLPSVPGNMTRQSDFNYTGAEQHRLWQVWIDTLTQSPILELEIKYPDGVLQRSDGVGYRFRVALEWSPREADRVNSAFSGELKAEEGLTLNQQYTPFLKLIIPNSSK